MATIRLEDGRVVPSYNGEALAWNLGGYNTIAEEKLGFPRLKAVLAEMTDNRLIRERRTYQKATFDRMFGHNAKKILALIDAEIGERKVER